MLKFGRLATVVVACILLLVGCGNAPEIKDMGLPPKHTETGGPEPVGYIGFQPPFLPIMISLDANGEFKVSTKAQIVTVVGAVVVGGGVVMKKSENKPLPQPPDLTQLIVCHTESNGQNCQAYEIRTGRKIRIDMEGRFRVDVEHKRIKVDVAPGSTITVTDVDPPSEPVASPAARIDVEGIHFYDTSEQTEVDLELDRSGTRTDLAYDHITGELKPINGARISQIQKDGGWFSRLDASDVPSENGCKNTPSHEWKDAFGPDDLELGKNSIACVKTAEGDFGYLVIHPYEQRKLRSFEIYSYTWVR